MSKCAVFGIHVQAVCRVIFFIIYFLVLVFQLFFSFSFVLVFLIFFRFSFSFSFVNYLLVLASFSFAVSHSNAHTPTITHKCKHKQTKYIEPADEGVLMICLNTVYCQSQMQCPIAVVSYCRQALL